MLEPRHPSIMPDPKLSQYCLSEVKYYYLPLHSQTHWNPVVEAAIGAANASERTAFQIQSSILQAKKGKFSAIKIPFDRCKDQLFQYAFKSAEDSGLGIVLQVSEATLNDPLFLKELLHFSKEHSLEILVDGSSDKKTWERVQGHFTDVHLTIVVHKKTNWPQIISGKIIKRLHLYFPFSYSREKLFLNCRQAQRVLEKLAKKYPDVQLLPPKGVDIYDPRVEEDFPLEPFLTPCFQSQSRNPQPRMSVVIPSYNCQNHLRVTLNHLYQQDIGLDSFEVIVVDDGGTDHSQRLVMEWLSERPEPMNFKYIYFPRARQRVMGDSQYRAGIARNLGAKNAVGESLCFLDSDIVVPKDYLHKVEEGLNEWDALQARRINLKEAASSLDCQYAKIDSSMDIMPEDPYWEKFNAKTDQWHEMPYNWKYVCTHSFSIKTDLFWKLGGLKRNFIFYGFEDTDLGYRITKTGHKLHLLDVKVFHLFHDNRRSEFQNMKSLRHILLSRTAQIFYLHHLDNDIFYNLNGFMAPEFQWKGFFSHIFKFFTLQWLWRKQPLVFSSLKKLPGGAH